MARPSNTEQRRAQIVQGLMTVMAERGYEGATIVAIARAAGLSPGLVHYHFDSKQSILVALVERIDATLAARLRRRLADAGNGPEDELDACIDAYLALGDDADPEALQAWVFVGAEALRQPEVREVYGRAIARRADELAACLRSVLAAEGRSRRGARRIAALVLSAIEGAYQLGTAAPEALPRGFAATSVRRAAHALIAAEPEA